MSIEEDIRFVAEKLGWEWDEGITVMSEDWPSVQLPDDGPAFAPGNEEDIFAFIAYAKAELAKLGHRITSDWVDNLSGRAPVMKWCYSQHAWQGCIVPVCKFDPTDPMSVAAAELQAMREVLS